MKIWAPVALAASLNVLLIASGSAPAQTQAAKAPAPPVAAKPDYARESAIFDSLARVFRYAADGTGTKDISGVVEIRDQAAVKNFSVLPFAFASSAEHVEIDYVRVRRADGTVVETPASDAQEQPAPVTREAPFYSDLKEEQIPVRSLREGDHLEYHIRIVRTKPEAPGHFWGSDTFFRVSTGFVVLSESVELRVPATSYVNAWSPKFKPTITTTADETSYRWQSSQLQPVAGKKPNELLRMENDPSLGTNTDPAPPDIAWTNFHTWAEVGAWYRGLEGSRTQPDDDTRARVATLIAGKSTDEARAQAIYGFVAPQVRYIGVAFGIGRYQPHEAGDVLRNQYGDCKDKTTLLASMLASANIQTDAVLIGVLVPFVPEVPSPGAFNHAINLAHVGGKSIWLDSTSEVAPYNFLQSPIRGKKALIIPLSGDAYIETTPADAPFPSEQRFDAVGTLDDKGTAHSHITLDLRGDDEVVFRQAVRSISPAQWDQFMQTVSQSMSYAGKVSNAKFSKPEDTSTPFHIDYDYEREKSGDWPTLRIIPQLAPIALGDVDEKDLPVKPIEIGVPHVEISHAVMQLPKGWRADLPAAIHTKTTFATIDKTYKFDNGTLTVDRRFVILKENIPASDWKTYQKWYKDSGLDGETYVQLHADYSQPDFAGEKVLTLNGNSKPDVAKLILKAFQDEQKGNLLDAKADLDEAKAIAPRDSNVANAYQSLDQVSKQVNDFVADMKQKIVDHPDDMTTYSVLAGYQMSKENTQGAIETMQQAVAHNPTNEQAVLYLAGLYRMRSDLPSTEKTFRTALQVSPADVVFKVSLANTLLLEGKKDEAMSLLNGVLATTDNPEELGAIAFALAGASVELPTAEKTARRSLELFDIASNNGETGPTALVRANMVVSTWDTLGWILYEEGKLVEAETWLRAAWRNSNGATPGYHLAMLLEKQHHAADALTQLQLASESTTKSEDPELKKRIAAKLEEMLASGPIARVKNATIELQEERTYNLPRGETKPTGQGWAMVELKVTAQAITGFSIVQGDDTLQPLADTVRHLSLDLLVPPESHATLLRRGVLSCHSSSTCELVLISTVDALKP